MPIRKGNKGVKGMEVIYNVENKFKNVDNKTQEEIKNIFNIKLLNIIIKLENKEIELNNP